MPLWDSPLSGVLAIQMMLLGAFAAFMGSGFFPEPILQFAGAALSLAGAVLFVLRRRRRRLERRSAASQTGSSP